MPEITVCKCDFCSRMWKPGKKDKAVVIEIIISPHDTTRFKEGRQMSGIYCQPSCAEMAIAARLLHWRPSVRSEKDKPTNPHPMAHPVWNIFGGPIQNIVDDTDDDEEERI
jgi:hypothetical protein